MKKATRKETTHLLWQEYKKIKKIKQGDVITFEAWNFMWNKFIPLTLLKFQKIERI